MSRKNELIADLKGVGLQLGGAHLTRQARDVTYTNFANTMRELRFGIRSVEQIGGRHLKAYVEARKAEGISNRTICNEMSHLRAALIAVGKEALANSPEYSNKALGIDGGSRIGTKLPLSELAIKTFEMRMVELGRPGIGAVLELQRALGLREAEAIRGGNPETLPSRVRIVAASIEKPQSGATGRRRGSIRKGIQRPGGGAVAAAGERRCEGGVGGSGRVGRHAGTMEI